MRDPFRKPWRPPLAAIAMLALAPALAAPPGLRLADRVVVYKAERRLELIRGNEILRSFRIALGLEPEGGKRREGDFRTPEGRYTLIQRNPDSEYFLAIRISYPSEEDVRRARAAGRQPGGAVMIHGQPNNPRHSPEYYRRIDWTNGCIAVSNADMIEIWLMTGINTPIEIRP